MWIVAKINETIGIGNEADEDEIFFDEMDAAGDEADIDGVSHL